MSQEVSPFTGFVEFAPSFQQREKIQHVLFDFDGTLSLVREGWPQVMLLMFVEMLPKRSDDTQEDLERMLLDDIMKLNGKQTIYQMIQLAERIRERGGHPKDPLWYKHEYLRRLDQRIAERKQAIRERRLTQDEVLVHGARHLLERLAEKGLPIYLASGTDEPFVKEEAAILGIEDFFDTQDGLSLIHI